MKKNPECGKPSIFVGERQSSALVLLKKSLMTGVINESLRKLRGLVILGWRPVINLARETADLAKSKRPLLSRQLRKILSKKPRNSSSLYWRFPLLTSSRQSVVVHRPALVNLKYHCSTLILRSPVMVTLSRQNQNRVLL